ncbi:MAG: class IIb bacteriocin, lactobin A/cerein 7B family [Proteobacteria bacterium]|nr:class IIb bacteriocin, lactobin A/cerein 7B family [Pseudomonadota bacterium]
MTQEFNAEIKTKLVAKAIQDEVFRQNLINNPNQAIKDVFGVEIPKGKSLHLLEQTSDRLYFIVPQRPAEITDNMTENEIIERLTRDIPRISDNLSSILDVYGKILAKIWKDPQFLDKFKADPKTFIGAENNTELPENMQICVQVEDDQNEYLAVPALVADSELTDEELELVSGGAAVIGTIIGAILLIGGLALAYLGLISW